MTQDVIDRLRAEGLRQRGHHGEHHRLAPADLSEPVGDVARHLLEDYPLKAGFSFVIFVRLDESDYLFLWRSSQFAYIDVRPLKGKHTEQNSLLEIESILETKSPYVTSLYGYVIDCISASHDCFTHGAPLLLQEQNVAALALVQADAPWKR